MVNVAGRSRGCRTCRKRRIKCDEGRPSCAKCIAGKINCEGYPEQGFIQVDFSLQHDGEKIKASRPKHNYPVRPRKTKRDAIQKESTSPESSTSWSDSQTPEPILFNEMTLAISMPEAPSLSGFMDLICQTYTSENLLRGVPNPDFLFPSNGAVNVDPAVLALSNIYFGVRHHDPATTTTARRRYGTSIKNLSSALQVSSSSTPSPPSTHTLIAVFTLGLYEFVAPSSVNGWVWHFMGLLALFERLGPDRVCRDQTLFDLLNMSGAMIAMAAMFLRQVPCIAKPEWKEAIWAPKYSKPLEAFLGIALLELLIDTPKMLILHDSNFDENGPSREFEEAREYTEQMQARLDVWLEQWNIEYGEAVPSTVPPSRIQAPVNLETGKPYWDTVLWYPDIQAANQLTRFWATSLTVARLSRRIRRVQAAWNGVLDIDTSAQDDYIIDCTIGICRSAEYHLQDHVLGIGSLMLLFPLRVAHRMFTEGDTRRVWIEKVIGAISSGKGSWQSAKEILDMQPKWSWISRPGVWKDDLLHLNSQADT